jgi:hypothetical protein
MKNPDIKICNLIESKMNEILLTINKTYSIFESDKLHSELNEFIKLKYTLLCSSYNTCIQFMLLITFLELILFLNISTHELLSIKSNSPSTQAI